MPTEQQSELIDIFVVGGGINGVGIANDAAGRGLKVVLCEQADLAQATSSASSKLIHGGLRYLEYYEFRLVREALREREVLLGKAPHIVWPLRFILPHQPHLRPAWMIRAGLFLYDNLGKRDSLLKSRGLRFDSASPLVPELQRGFEYSDCWVDDARLVIVNALQAKQNGAEIMVRTRCITAHDEGGQWRLILEDLASGKRYERHARVLVNAAGPWVENFIRTGTQRQSRYRIRMVQGSHIVVPRINTDERAYMLQNSDSRIVFVLPYEQDFSLIGTTDVRYRGDPAKVTASEEEIAYLLALTNSYFKAKLTREDVITTYSGVRPLCDDEDADPSAMTRDYTLDLDHSGAPLLSVFGGKITTYRKLAEAALDELKPSLPEMGPKWTAHAQFPGGDIGSQSAFTARLVRAYPFLGETRARRFAASYGSLCLEFLQGCNQASDLGEDFGGGLTRREVDYLIAKEWAQDTSDILWRRTKMILRLDETQRLRLAEYLEGKRCHQAA